MSSQDKPSDASGPETPPEGAQGTADDTPAEESNGLLDLLEQIRAEHERRMADPAERAKADALAAASRAAMGPPELGPGEEARWFSTSGDSWSGLAGRAGWEIVKDGRVVRRIVRLMS
jgi:hypothetical protein